MRELGVLMGVVRIVRDTEQKDGERM